VKESIIVKFDAMPEFLSSHDLISLGLFHNPNAVCSARSRGFSPDYIKVGRKIFYPKSRLVEWIMSRMQNGAVPKNKAL
jgi:hypothetical protein